MKQEKPVKRKRPVADKKFLIKKSHGPKAVPTIGVIGQPNFLGRNDKLGIFEVKGELKGFGDLVEIFMDWRFLVIVCLVYILLTWFLSGMHYGYLLVEENCCSLFTMIGSFMWGVYRLLLA
jgi:hypothetical protein